MRTTLDLPDEVFKQAKLKAVHEGVPFKVIVTRALKRDLAASTSDKKQRRARASRLFTALDQAKNTQPVGRLNRDELHVRTVLR